MVNSTGETCYAYGEYLTQEKVERRGSTPVVTPEPTHEYLTEWNIGDHAYANVSKRLILRKGPAIKTKSIGYIERETIVEIMSEMADTGYIEVKVLSTGKVAYVDSFYLMKIEEDECECQEYDVMPGMEMYVKKGGNLNFREEPSMKSNILFQLRPGEEVMILSWEVVAGFVNVCYPSDWSLGYVKLEFLTFDRP